MYKKKGKTPMVMTVSYDRIYGEEANVIVGMELDAGRSWNPELGYVILNPIRRYKTLGF